MLDHSALSFKLVVFQEVARIPSVTIRLSLSFAPFIFTVALIFSLPRKSVSTFVTFTTYVLAALPTTTFATIALTPFVNGMPDTLPSESTLRPLIVAVAPVGNLTLADTEVV